MILNLHGLNGSSYNTNYKLLIDLYSKDFIISPQMDYILTSPTEILDRLKRYKDIDYIVGNSFGGFYAYVLSNMCNIPCLLVNPCIPPERYIPFLVEEYKFTDELINLMAENLMNPNPVYMILGMQDDVLLPAYTEQIVHTTKVWKIQGGHSLSNNQLFYSVFKESVKKYL